MDGARKRTQVVTRYFSRRSGRTTRMNINFVRRTERNLKLYLPFLIVFLTRIVISLRSIDRFVCKWFRLVTYRTLDTIIRYCQTWIRFEIKSQINGDINFNNMVGRVKTEPNFILDFLFRSFLNANCNFDEVY